MTRVRIVGAVLAVLVPVTASQVAFAGLGAQAKSASQPKPASATKKIPAAEIDGLLAPVALYPDQLLAQMLLCATTPARVTDLDKWLKTNPPFKGTALQDAAKQSKFEPSFVALVPFPQVVDFMATNLDWTTKVGQAFSSRPGRCARQRPAPPRRQPQDREAEELGAAGRESQDNRQRKAGDRHRAGKPAGRVRAAVQHPDCVLAAADVHHRGRARGRRRCRRGHGRRAHRVHGWHRDRRGDGQRLLLRSVWLARQPPHVQRRVGRLVRRSRGCARGLVRQPRGRARGLRGQSRGPGGLAKRAGVECPGTTHRAAVDRAAAADRAPAERPVVCGIDGQTARSSGGTSTSARATGQAATPTTQSASGGTSSYQARGQDRDRSSTAAERSGTGSDAFSNYSSGKSERSASARGQSSRSGGGGGGSRGSGGGSRGGGGGRRR